MVLERRCDGGGMCGEDADALFRQSRDATKNEETKIHRGQCGQQTSKNIRQPTKTE